MQTHVVRRIILLIFFLAVVVGVIIYLSSVSKEVVGPLQASGTVEAVEVVVVPEMAGRIRDVLVQEGDLVQAGDVLLRLDDELLNAQRQRALAALEAAQTGLTMARAVSDNAQAAFKVAQAQYELALYLARLENIPARLVTWRQKIPEDFLLPVWYFQPEEELAAAKAEVQAAEEALKIAQVDFENVIQEAGNAELLEAETRLAEAQAGYLVAEQVLELARAQDDEELERIAQENFDAAEAELEAAQSEYEQLLSEEASADVLTARARLAVTKERYETALDTYNQMLSGDDSPQVQVALAGLHQAEVNLAQAEAGILQAEKVVAQAQAELGVIDVQMEKLVVYAAVSGVVMTRDVEPGEVVQPGTVTMTIGQLDKLTITVYIPEDRYGTIALGDVASVQVDSFLDETFEAVVIRIAGEAEFTPRSVQTVEGRRTTVFAIELSVEDTYGKLKPGMPADVTFEN
ncbi:MAG: efflux RND transporter periplasmic adaptor subunit [Chloroflexota bacterium]